MKIKFLFVCIFAAAFSILEVQAAAPKHVYVTGPIVSQTEKVVVIRTETGNAKVPPRSIVSRRMENGKNVVTAKLTLEALIALN